MYYYKHNAFYKKCVYLYKYCMFLHHDVCSNLIKTRHYWHGYISKGANIFAYPPSNKNCKGVVRTDRARGEQDQENG